MCDYNIQTGGTQTHSLPLLSSIIISTVLLSTLILHSMRIRIGKWIQVWNFAAIAVECEGGGGEKETERKGNRERKGE